MGKGRQHSIWRNALVAALVLVALQVALECVAIAVLSRHVIFPPYGYSPWQCFDFCLKLFAHLPGANHWLAGGALNRFQPPGIVPKLSLASALVLPNIVVAVPVAVALAWLDRRRQGRSSTPFRIVTGLVAFGLLVHLIETLAAVHLPEKRTLWIVVRNAGRVVIWDGAGLALLVLLVAWFVAALCLRGRTAIQTGAGLLAAGGLLLLVALPIKQSTSPSTAPPPRVQARGDTGKPLAGNVILVSIDSLRADHLGCYGNPHATSPTIDRLASAGTRFTDASSSTSWTLPAHASMFTGRYLSHHGVVSERDRLGTDLPTLAGRLTQSGMDTGGIISMLFLSRKYGLERGFEEYDDKTIPATTASAAIDDEPAAMVTQLAERWLRTHAERRFFLFLHYWDVHYDYIPPAPYNTMFDPDYTGKMTGRNFYYNPAVRRGMAARDLEHIRALYDGEIRWVDDQLSRLMAVVDELGVRERTTIVITSDHGDEFFEHGNKGHRRTLYREVVQIPLVVAGPGIAHGTVVDEPVSIVDIMPTILEIAGAGTPAGLDGVSLVPFLRGGATPARRPRTVYAELCSHGHRNCQVMQHSRSGTLIHRFRPLGIEFYGPHDAAERDDLGDSETWPRKEQFDRLNAWLNAGWPVFQKMQAAGGRVKMDAATRERLRSLGYLE